MGAQLRSADQEFLDEKFSAYEVHDEGGHVCVVLPAFQLPPGLTPEASDLLIRLPAGFPDQAPDMFWFGDLIGRPDGVPVPAVDVIETHLGREWRRWSRHLQPGEWNSGIDGLRTYVAYVVNCLQTAAPEIAA